MILFPAFSISRIMTSPRNHLRLTPAQNSTIRYVVSGWGLAKTRNLEGKLNATFFGVVAIQGSPIFLLAYSLHCEIQSSIG